MESRKEIRNVAAPLLDIAANKHFKWHFKIVIGARDFSERDEDPHLNLNIILFLFFFEKTMMI